jgi:hypothetical protein
VARKKLGNEEPKTKIGAEAAYVKGELIPGVVPPAKKKKSTSDAVKKFGAYLRGVATGENRRAFEKVFQEHWKQEELKKKIAKKKEEVRRIRTKKWLDKQREDIGTK